MIFWGYLPDFMHVMSLFVYRVTIILFFHCFKIKTNFFLYLSYLDSSTYGLDELKRFILQVHKE